MIRSVQRLPLTPTLLGLEQQRSALRRAMAELGDFRPGSITGTGGRCGNKQCHCHQPGDPGHAPHPRLTYKLNGKSITESFATPAAQRKAEREIEAFRRHQELNRTLIGVNTQICQLRTVEDALSPQEKKRSKSSKVMH